MLDKTKAIVGMMEKVVSEDTEDISIPIPPSLKGPSSKMVLPALLREKRLSTPKDGSTPITIYSDIQRNFAKMYVHTAAYIKEPCQEFKTVAQFNTSLYSRTAFQAALWKSQLAVNSRDSENTSSAYLVGAPLVNADGSSLLKTWQVAIHEYVAKHLNVVDGTLVQFGRFPPTDILPMEIVIDNSVGHFGVGLPMGSLEGTRIDFKDVPSIVGGDADGDCYTIIAYHKPLPEMKLTNSSGYQEASIRLGKCKVELREWFKTFWLDIPEYPTPTLTCYSWQDEAPKVQEDFDIFWSKVMQKDSIGTVTNTNLALFVAKIIKSKLFQELSWADIRNILHFSTEAAMDMKQCDGGNPLLGTDLLTNKAILTEDARLELATMGFDVNAMETAINACNGKNVREIAGYNKTFGSMLNKRTHFEALATHFLADGGDPDMFADYFKDVLYGFKRSPFIKGTDGAVIFPGVSKTGAAKNPDNTLVFFEIDKDNQVLRSTEMDCDGNQDTILTDNIADAIPETLRVECTTSAGTVGVDFLLEANGLVMTVGSAKIILRETVHVPFKFVGQEMLVVPCPPVLLESWGQVLSALIFTNFKFDLDAVKECTEVQDAEPKLAELVVDALRCMLAAYEVQNNDVFTEGMESYSWSTMCGQEKYVVLDNKIPTITSRTLASMKADNITPADNDAHKLEQSRRILAGKFLKSKGLINYMSDTIVGEPGMAFYRQNKDGLLFCMEQFIVPQFAAVKQRGKLAAISGLIPFTGAHPVSFALPMGVEQAPTIELMAVALPRDLMDAIEVSDALSEQLNPLVYDAATKSYVRYELQNGQKLQAVEADVKGVGIVTPADKMVWVKMADGQMIRAEVQYQLGSKKHQLLRMTHFRMALGMVARQQFLKTGERMPVAPNLTEAEVCDICVKSGLYADESLLVEVYAADKVTLLGKFPAGILAMGMHRQVPSICTSVHAQELYAEKHYATSTSDGGVVSGLMVAISMMAHDLGTCLRELHWKVPVALAKEVGAYLRCIELRPETELTDAGDNATRMSMMSK